MTAYARTDFFTYSPAAVITIASGVITATQATVIVAAESGTADDLATINLPAAIATPCLLFLKADAGDAITVKHGTGNINLNGGADVTLSGDKVIALLHDGTECADISVANAAESGLAGVSSNGLIARTGAGTYAARTITGTSNEISVSNGDGVSGNPTLSLPATIDLGGKTSFEIPNAAGGTTVDAAGEVTIDTTSKTFNFYDGAAERVVNPVLSRSITLEAPSAAENATIFHVDKAITITKVVAVVVGSSTPSVTIQIEHDTSRSGSGNDLFSSGQAITSTTTGSSLTSFSDATVPLDSFIWLTTSAKSGTVNELHVTIYYTIDA